jgi:hypothetical protein
MGFEAEKRAQAARADGGHFGALGERVSTFATVVRINYTEGYQGSMKTIVTFVTEAGQELTWFATGSAPSTGDVGKKFAIVGTVKKHDTYKGRAQTILARVNWEPLVAESASSTRVA